MEKDVNKYDYYGLYHYRRLLNINADDLKHAFADDVDVILPYPMLYLPNIREHHTRYSNEEEWEMMLKVVGEIGRAHV